MAINLKLSKKLFVPKFYPYLTDYSHRWEFFMGSAGSAKSYFITQKLIIRACSEKIRILVCRRYGTTIRQSCFSLFKDILAKWNLLALVKVNESDFRITFPNGSEIIFMGLDDEAKLLSLNNVSTVFVEEAFEVEKAKVEQLNLRMRGKAKNQQIILAWNPISQDSWLYDFSVTNPPENSIFIHSTYKDNPFLSEPYVASLEELQTRNPAKWRIFGLGEWGIDEEGLVFRNWRVEEFDPGKLASQGLEMRVGSDLGYVDPTTIVCSLYDKQNHRIYVYDEFYQSGLQLEQVAEQMKKMELKHCKIYMDSAEPRSIEFFRQKGFNTYPCLKGQNSVRSRIQFLQNNEIIVLPSCENVIRELKNFSYIKDKKTDKWTEDTTHEFSHAIDGLGYAYSNIYMNNKLGSLDKSLLGI